MGELDRALRSVRAPRPGLGRRYAGVAQTTVLRFVHTTYVRMHPRLKVAGASAGDVLLVRHWLPSGWVKSECGLRVWERSLVIGVYFPALDPPHNPIGHCNDCAAIRFLAARTSDGWLVWGNF